MFDRDAWLAYVQSVTDAPQRSIASRMGVSQSTVSRWFTGDRDNRPSAALAVDFARAYRGNPVHALVAAGYLDAEEARARRDNPDPKRIPLDVLLAEVSRRAGRGEEVPA